MYRDCSRGSGWVSPSLRSFIATVGTSSTSMYSPLASISSNRLFIATSLSFALSMGGRLTGGDSFPLDGITAVGGRMSSPHCGVAPNATCRGSLHGEEEEEEFLSPHNHFAVLS